jgi:hypothetical protein
MEDSILKNIITSFDKDAFSKFIYDLWSFKASDTDTEMTQTYYLPQIGNGIFEHYKTEYTTKEKIMTGKQIYTLIFPFFYPLELFKETNTVKIHDNQLLQCLKKYQQIVFERHSAWFYPTDGMYYMPNIAFISNFAGLSENTYQDIIIPHFEELVNRIKLDAQIAIGTVDSFLALEKGTVEKVLSLFMEKYKSGIVISFNDSDMSIGEIYIRKIFNKRGTQKFIISM